MYLGFFGLAKEPFQVTPDPEFIYLSESHKEALASIIYGTEQKKGFVAITGAVGAGKTTVLRFYLARLREQPDGRVKTIYVLNPELSFKDLVKTIYRELGLRPGTKDVFEMVSRLHRILIEEYKEGNNVAVIIDEAQNMPVETLESLRMLSNLETSTDKLIQIVLVGQPELDDLLMRHELRQLSQRIAVRATILPLTDRESREYIAHRLGKAGSKDGPVFTAGAIRKIVKEARGIPRRINVICDNALITGFGYQQKPVASKTVDEVCADLHGRGTETPTRTLRTLWAGFPPVTGKTAVLGGAFLVILALISLSWLFFRPSGQAPVSKAAPPFSLSAVKVPGGAESAPQTLVGADNGEYIMVCEKSTKKLYLYRCGEGNISRAGAYGYAGFTGPAGSVDIPPGIYFSGKMDGKSGAAKNVPDAIPIRYGTPGRPGAEGGMTEGYITMAGGSGKGVPGDAVKTGTPVVIVDKVQPADPARQKETWKDLQKVVEGWRKAWESKDAGQYLAYYARDFTSSNGMGLQAFGERKKRILAAKGAISVSIGQKVFLSPPLRGGSVAVVKLSQTYHSKKITDVSIKALHLRKDRSGWKIVREENIT